MHEDRKYFLFRLEVISCTVCDFYLRDDKDKRISTAICALNRSVVLSKVSGSAIMLSELDIKNYFEFAKELTLKAGEVSHNKTVTFSNEIFSMITKFSENINDIFVKILRESDVCLFEIEIFFFKSI